MVGIAKTTSAIGLFAAVILATCSAAYIRKTPAKVLISQARSNEDVLKVDIKDYGKVHQLRMNPAKNIWSKRAKIMAIKNKDGAKYIEELDLAKNFKVYKDSKVGAVLAVRDGGTVNGIAGHLLAIKYENGNHNLYTSFEKRNNNDDYLEVPNHLQNATSSRARIQNRNDYLEIPEINRPNINKHANTRQATTYSVEVVAVVDSTLASEFATNEALYEYLTIFWNAVNERYDTITSPTIEVKVVGAVIIRDSADEPFITDNMINADQIDGSGTLNSFSAWVKDNSGTLPPGDVYYLHTGKDMVDTGSSSSSLAGLAWRAAACLSNSTLDFSSGMGEDIGGFYDGVHTATHELAHILGAPHDGEASLGTGACLWSDGYIMSYIAGTINRLFFSQCSIDTISAHLSTVSCVNADDTVDPSPCIPETDQLPGDVLTMDEQCKELTGYDNATVDTVTTTDENSLCYNMKCLLAFANGTGKIYTFGAVAPENAPCPSGGKCVDGQCV